jgi:hypothetical protein
MPIRPQGRIQPQKRQEVAMSAQSRPYEAISSDKAGLQLLSHPPGFVLTDETPGCVGRRSMSLSRRMPYSESNN